MGTRSRIGLVNEDGSIQSIYCHWDGYPSWNGKVLLENYNTEEKVRELVDLGSISSLRPNVAPDSSAPHTFENSQDDVTVAYHRDRGEDWKHTQPNVQPTQKALLEWMQEGWEEYIYLFKDGKWRYSSYTGPKLKMKDLTPQVCERD